jgi:signal transduction histidine kinase
MADERGDRRWHRRARLALRHSLRVRMVVLFLLLALATTVVFLAGMQKALSVGWRDGARPLLVDYVDRLAADIGTPPSLERAQAIAARLPVSVRISGPMVQWESEPMPRNWRGDGARWRRDAGEGDLEALLVRHTADGHRIEFGLSQSAWQNQPRRVGWATLTALLVFTAIAFLYVRRLLRPLDDIRDGARRFGGGDFAQPIPVRRRDELGVLAQDVNAMAHDIHGMLDAKRALLLAISHELRSPLTRARLNTELLPDADPAVRPLRDALLRDLAVMRDLVADLLESERLAGRHAALQREPTDLAVLMRDVMHELAQSGVPGAGRAVLQADAGLPAIAVDRARVRLLMRNLLDNALRHGSGAAEPVGVGLHAEPGGGVALVVRDHGPGVPDAALAHLAEPFWRPDSARGRDTGGVGLGLHLCRLVVQAHGGQWSVRNAQPGLEVRVTLPPAPR